MRNRKKSRRATQSITTVLTTAAAEAVSREALPAHKLQNELRTVEQELEEQELDLRFLPTPMGTLGLSRPVRLSAASAEFARRVSRHLLRIEPDGEEEPE